MWDKISREERISRIREGVKDGLSAGQIAERIGGCTRNAIIGLAERAKVPLRSKITLAGHAEVAAPPAPAKKPKEKPINPRLPAKQPAPLKEKTKPVIVADDDPMFEKDDRPETVVDLPEPEPLKLSMPELTDKVCRWPIGDPLQHAHFYFCGNPTGGMPSYCKYHARKAHWSPARRK
ncbi:GcrA family cell cycle regulator [Mesorhizobium silamurunense]|uniref:GcrA family cell cycle regulator n=1 Tax=Mesorhizobium silamurunense TaxID=499528 RepID=UPI00177F370D|nr:GcrA family cell cycle regulator [Mesorhizobium silamurunense]